MPNMTRLMSVLVTRRSGEFLWVLPLMLNSLGLNTLTRYARKPLQPLVHYDVHDLSFRRMFKFIML